MKRVLKYIFCILALLFFISTPFLIIILQDSEDMYTRSNQEIESILYMKNIIFFNYDYDSKIITGTSTKTDEFTITKIVFNKDQIDFLNELISDQLEEVPLQFTSQIQEKISKQWSTNKDDSIYSIYTALDDQNSYVYIIERKLT